MSRIFLVSYFVFWLICSTSFAMDDDFYTIDDIEIHSSGESASEAKNKAFIDSRRNGLAILFDKIGLDPITLEKFSDEDLEETVKSEQVKSEVIAGSNYSAILKITYDKNYIDYALKRKKLENLDLEENYIALPITKIGDDFLLWEKENIWKESIGNAINERIAEDSDYKIFVLDGDIENVSTISRKAILEKDYKMFVPTLFRYNAKGVYLISFFNDTLNQKIVVNVSLIKKTQKKHIKFSFINTSSIAENELVNMVASKTINYLMSINGKKLRNHDSNIKEIEIRTRSYSRWLKTKQKIEDSGLISDFIIKSISKDKAVILVKYIGKNPDLALGFKNIGLNIERTGENNFKIDN